MIFIALFNYIFWVLMGLTFFVVLPICMLCGIWSALRHIFGKK
jgi:uncharacterized membrane protein YgaE (UPF0421/DUF939 family)